MRSPNKSLFCRSHLLYAEAVSNKHLPSEQSATRTPAFSTRLLPCSPRNWLGTRISSSGFCQWSGTCSFNSASARVDLILSIPTAAYLPVCPVPPAGRAVLQLCQGAFLPLPGHCSARFMLPPPKGILVQVAAKCSGFEHGKAGGAAVSIHQTKMSQCGLSKQPSLISALGPALGSSSGAVVNGGRFHGC